MRLQRLVLHAGTDDDVFKLDLHPRLTVISGAGRIERDGLVNEILGALGSSRPGVHLELIDDRERALAVFRPDGARHRVVDIDRGVDVTGEFEREGSIDLLAAVGDAGELRERMHISGTDLSSEANHGDLVRRLAELDPGPLWDAASALREVESELVEVTAGGASCPVDAELVSLIEARHGELQEAVDRLESVRSSTFILAAALTLFAILSILFATPAVALPLLLGAVGSTGVSLRRWLEVRRASAAEDETLRSAGMSSYLSFQLQRVDGLVSSQGERQRLVELSRIHHEALTCWRAVAGDVDVSWAWLHRHEIERARGAGAPSAIAPSTGLAATLSARFHAVATCGPIRPPVVLDEPFLGVGEAELCELVSLILSATDHLQLILLTEDPRLAAWARLERLGSGVSHLELDAAPIDARRSPTLEASAP